MCHVSLGDLIVPKHSLFLKFGQCFNHQFIWCIYPNRLNVELELRLFLPKVDFATEVLIPDTLSASRACFSLVSDNSFRLAALLSLFTEILNVKDTHGADLLKFFGLLTDNRLIESNIG